MTTMREMSLEEAALQYGSTHRAAKEYAALRTRVAELERERDQLALSLSATRAERDHAARSAELLEDELHNSESARRDFEHAWLEGRAIMAVSTYFGRMRGPDAWLDHGSWDEYPELFACAGVDLRSFQHGTRFYAGSAPVPEAQDFSLMQGGYCCECGHELCDTCAPLHPIMPWPAAQAEAKVADDVDLWKFCRDAMKRGAEIESQFSQQGYETFIAEIECAAKKEEKRLRAMLAAKAKGGWK